MLFSSSSAVGCPSSSQTQNLDLKTPIKGTKIEPDPTKIGGGNAVGAAAVEALGPLGYGFLAIALIYFSLVLSLN
jgi:hypothetical protein